jgi:predicted nucleic acid-binding protein
VKFADTSWWVAWALPGDARHDEALRALGQLRRGEQILTSNLVVGETWTFLRRKDSHRTALALLERVEVLVSAGRLVVHRVAQDQEAAAWDWLRRHYEREYSFVDATSFRVMRDRRLREALAFDQDFAAAGFIEVPRT